MRFLKTAATLCAGLLWASASPAAADSGAPSLTILFTGFVEGTFGPCGCDTNPNGGLARRAGYASSLLNPPAEGSANEKETGRPLLHVDLGNYFKPLGPHSQAINQMMIEGLRELPMKVLNLTPGDLFMWEELNRIDLPETRVISTNLSPLDRSAKAPDKHAVVEVRVGESKVRVGFLGVSDPARVKPNSTFTARNPAEAAAEAILQLREAVDFFVVLADVPRNNGPLAKDSPLYRIAMENPQVYAVLSTEKRYLLHRAEQVNNAVILSSVERGRHLGRLTFSFSETGEVTAVKPEYVNMGAGVPEDPEFLRAQRKLESRLP